MKSRPSPSLFGRVAFVTGASGALGADVARQLHARGVRVALLGRNTDKLHALAQELGGPEHALPIEMNVRNMASVEAAAKTAYDHFGSLDIVIAGAGMVTTALTSAYSATGFQDDIDTNLNGVWRTFKATLDYVKESRGHLVAISSLAAFVHLPGMSAYAASKVGVMALCDSLRLELAGTGVTVGTIHPTFFESALGEALIHDSVLTDASGGFGGAFKPVPRATVVSAIMENIEKRSRTIVLPRLYQVAAYAPGAVQLLLEPLITFNMKRARKS